MCSAEDSDLKRLLSSWHCEILYNLFREEDITINELKYIKYRHVVSLLRNYKMGVRIRFEHYLEKWRNKIGIPYYGEEDIDEPKRAGGRFRPGQSNRVEVTLSDQADLQNNYLNYRTETPGGQVTPVETPFVLNSPLSVTENESLTLEDARYSLRRRPELDHARSESEEGSRNASQFLTTILTTKEEPTSNNHSASSRNNYNKCPYSLPQILQMSGARGIGIIKYYDDHQCFTNAQRVQLIQVICDFYEDNEYHLSLHMSHALEMEILQMFPTEKLQYYRTEKRGKIYVKFTNMKRQRKERSSTGRLNATERGAEQLSSLLNTDESHIKIQNMAEMSENKSRHNIETASCDAWSTEVVVEPDIDIKPEEVKEP